MEIVEEATIRGRVMAGTHDIVKSLGTSENITTDMSHTSAMDHQNPGNPPGESANIDTNLASADRIISRWDSRSSKLMLFQSSPKETNEYLAAVDGLHDLMATLVVTHSSSTKLVRAQHLMEMSMACLEKEFHRILSSNVKPTMEPADANSSRGSTDEELSGDGSLRSRNLNADEICEIDMMPLDAVLDLRSIAKRMVAGGYVRDCVRIYGQTRKSVIEGCLNRIGVDLLSTSDVQKMEWGILDTKIKNWIRAVSIVVRILFASEKQLCEEIFAGLHHVRDSCFAEVVKEPTTKLLGFGESVAMTKKSSERLFRVLDMYESLWDLMPDIDTVYCQESCASVRTQASMIFVRLRESALGILMVFENEIQSENSKTPVPGGTIHPLTGYVMNYLSFLSDYKETLMNITANAPIDIPKGLPDDLMGMFGDIDWHDNELGSRASGLSVKLGWIIIILQCNLDLKSNVYKDVALSYLFLMNNLQYIVKKVKDSKLLGLLGYRWLRKNQDKVRHYAANYERAAWMKALNCLKDDGIHVTENISTGLSLQTLKITLEGFNCAIEEVLRSHSGWMVPDVQLREEITISIAEKIIPAYRSFLGRLKKNFESGRHSEMFIKYTPEDLETRILDLFHGNPLSPCNSSSSLSLGRSIPQDFHDNSSSSLSLGRRNLMLNEISSIP